MGKRIIGPDLADPVSFRELPIGSAITGVGAETVRTGGWRFYRPRQREKVPPCQAGCPAGVDVRGFISLIRQKRFQEAYQSYRLENPFPGLCGRLCDHSCEGHCLRTQFDGAVDIQDLELFVSSMGGREEIDQNPLHTPSTIVVVGNGVAELACVYFLRRLGYGTVLVAEESDIARVSGKIVGGLGLPIEASLHSEIEGALRLRSGEATAITGLAECDPRHMGEHDAVVWGLDSEPPAGIRTVFQFSRNRVSVSQAVGRGKEGAITVDQYLKRRDLKQDRKFIALGPSGFLSFGRYLRFREKKVLETQDIVRFEEINTRTFQNAPRLRNGRRARPFLGEAFGTEKGVRAARRCFACGWCNLCGQCIRHCPEQVVARWPRGRGVQFDYEFCKGCGICVFECPRGALDLVKEEVGWE